MNEGTFLWSCLCLVAVIHAMCRFCFLFAKVAMRPAFLQDSVCLCLVILRNLSNVSVSEPVSALYFAMMPSRIFAELCLPVSR